MKEKMLIEKKNKARRLPAVLSVLLTVLMLSVFFTSCKGSGEPSSGAAEEKAGKMVYFINRDRTRVQGEEFTFKTSTVEEQIPEMIEALSERPKHNELKTSLGKDFALLAYELNDETLTLNMDEAYKKLSASEEILVRAALVRSFTQIDGVRFVQLLVEKETLMDAGNYPVGLMSADSFVENEGKEINAYDRVNITLYFATEDGTGLVSVDRQVVYNTNVSMEKMVMEQLIKGPALAGYYPTVNPDTKILSVTNKDGTCYVNLSEDFLKQPSGSNVTAEVAIYSIANTLIDLHNVSRVQIQVGGSSKILYRETVSLEEPFDRNLDIVTKEE
jgi:germination protein M